MRRLCAYATTRPGSVAVAARLAIMMSPKFVRQASPQRSMSNSAALSKEKKKARSTSTRRVMAPMKVIAKQPISPLPPLRPEASKVLLAKAEYAIFTLGSSSDRTQLALYAALSNDMIVMKEEDLWRGAMWLDDHIGSTYIAGLIFPSDNSSELKHAATTLKEKAKNRLVVAQDTWSITFGSFRHQQEVVKGITQPKSLEHTAFLMGNKRFEAGQTSVSISHGKDMSKISLSAAEEPGAVRDALLNWDALVNIHKRFGTSGSPKSMDPVSQIVRRVVKSVNIFVIDINARVGKGTIAEGYTMAVSIYNSQLRTQSVHLFRSLSDDTQKLNALTLMLYGEGSSSISLFVPSPSTKLAQLVAFARTCRPKCPFFVAEIRSLSPFFKGANVMKDLDGLTDPKTVWKTIQSNCFPEMAKGSAADINLIRGFTALANKLYADRVNKVAVSISTALSTIPAPQDPAESFQEVTTLAENAAANGTPTLQMVQPLVNAVNTTDSEVVFGLQQWRSRIYEDKGRLQREQQAADKLQRYLVVDLETTTLKRYKRVANPFTAENYVVMSGALDYEGKMFLPKRYFDRRVAVNYFDPRVTKATKLVEGSSDNSLFLPPLDDYDVIVGHNVKFDLLHLWRDAEVRRFLKRGGRIWDTMYAEYLLTGQEIRLGRRAGLEDVAKSYGGRTPKLDAVKQAWADGKDTFQIPYSVLREYLIGDLKNTELIFNKHMNRALEQRQVQIIDARMDGLLCTTEMEYNGLKVDRELAVSQSNELSIKANELKHQLEDCYPPEIPLELRPYFNWFSNKHLIACFFGGALKFTTHSKLSKHLPTESFERHTLYTPASFYKKASFAKGVFFRPPPNVDGAAECLMMAGTGLTKGKIFKAYTDSYLRRMGLRRQSELTDFLCNDMVGYSRTDPEQQTAPMPLVHLLPRRHIFLFAAVLGGTSGKPDKIYMKNPISNESVTISSATADKAAAMKKFISTQVLQHTLRIGADADDGSMTNSNFSDAVVTILARDGACSFRRIMEADESIKRFLDTRQNPSESREVKDQFMVSIADATGIFLYYKFVYGRETQDAAQKKGAGSYPKETSLVVPFTALHDESLGRVVQTQQEMHALLKREAHLGAEEWCDRYISTFRHMARASLLREEKEELVVAKKKDVPKRGGIPRADSDLPQLMRDRHFFIAYYKNMPLEEKPVIEFMALLGRPCGSAYDGFAVLSGFEGQVTLPLRGRLATYIPNDLNREVLSRRFRSETTKSLQVGEDTLSYFVQKHNDVCAKTILELRAMEKLLGTYYEHSGGTGMVSLVHKIDSCIHHELLHNKTSTGRLASANPNCQNIPTEGKTSMREMFISRFGNDGRCIEADYSQLEVVTLAALAQDRQMIEDLHNRVDFHCKRVTMIRPDLSYDEVLMRAKKNKELAFVRLRQQAKIFSFQRQYGAGVKMLSMSTGLTEDQIRMLINKEREMYRACDVFNGIVTLSANSYIPSLQDGSRNVRGHQLFKGMFPVLTGSRYVFTESDLPSAMMKDKPFSQKSTNFSPTHLKNYPVQGFAGEIVQVMLGKLWRHFLQNENYGGNALLTNTVHDCVWVDSKELIHLEVAKDVEQIMSSARTVMNSIWPELNMQVDFPLDLVAGKNMGKLKPLDVKK